MSEKRFKTLTIIIEDDTGTVQTHIRSELSAPQLMDNIFELKEENEQLRKENFFLAYWKRKAMILLMRDE